MRWWKWMPLLAASLVPANVAHAALILPAIESVMTGDSSSGSDQVWFRVSGQPAGVPNECLYSAGGVSLFYVPAGSPLSTDKALSLLLTAKVTNRPVTVEIAVETGSSDFWGWGISRCRIKRIAIG